MSSADACTCRCSAVERRGRGQAPDRPPCCCEDRCTCPHCHGGPPPHYRHSHHRGGRGGWVREEGDAHHEGPRSARRCTSCVPEQAELTEADLFARQQRCEAARGAEQRRRASLANSVGHRSTGGCSRFYTPNTAEMLRCRSNLPYQAAVDAEYDARRRELQAELDARREEIAAMQRDREERRMEAAFRETEAARHRGSPRRSRSANHARPSSSPGHSKDACAPPPPPQPQPLKKTESPTRPKSPPGDEAKLDAPPTRDPHAHGDRTPPPLHHHHHYHNWGWPRGPRCRNGRGPPPSWDSWGHGWRHGSPPPCPCERRTPSPWQHSKCPPPPPPLHGRPFHHHDPHWDVDAGAADRQECPPSWQPDNAPPPQPLAHHSPKTAEGTASACPSCGHPLMSARDIVSMIAAGKLDNSVACPSCGFVGGTLRCPALHHGLPPHGQPSDDGGKGDRNRRGQSCKAAPRSHSAAAGSTSVSLTAPKFGHKVFITDDLYCDRRARYLAEWEECGSVRRVPPSHRSPSAPLPDRTQKWRTTGSGRCTD